VTKRGEIDRKLTPRPPEILRRNISLFLITDSLNAVYSTRYLTSHCGHSNNYSASLFVIM
jgi:hypothetical protein